MNPPVYIKNNGFGKVGDTVVAEPALDAFGKQMQSKIHFNVDYSKGHEALFAGHPWIVPVPYIPEGIKPDFEVNHSNAFHEAHAKNIPFGAGFFSQLGMSYEGKRVHYKSYYIDEYKFDILDKFIDSVIIVPNAYSCTSRDSTTGQFVPGKQGNCQPPAEWWTPIVESIPKDKKVFLLASSSSWDWVEIPGTEKLETSSFLYLLRILKSTDLVISVETGTLHLLSATKTPAVFLSCATPTVFAKPDCDCRVIKAWRSDQFRHVDVIKAIHGLLGVS